MRKEATVVRRVYRSFMLVSILTALTATLGMFIDNIIVGRSLGAEALGALGTVGPVALVLSALGNICSSGGAARAAQALGRGDRQQVNTVFTIAVLFALVTGSILTVAGLLWAPQLAQLLGAKGSLHQPAVQYLLGYLPGAVPTVMTTVLMSFIKLDGSPRLPLVCIGVMSLTNILLDLLTIRVLGLGMLGAGLATSLSYLLAALAGCTHFLKKQATLRPVRPRGLLPQLRAIVLTGAPTALSRLCDTLKVALLNNLLVTAGGAAAVAVLNVRTQTGNLVGALLMGVSQALVPVAGVFYGEKDTGALERTLREALLCGLVLSSGAAVLLWLFPAPLAQLLGLAEPQALAMARTALRLLALSLPLQLLNMVAMGFYQTTRSTGAATLVCVLEQLVLTTGFALLLLAPMGTDGVWLSFALAEAGTLLAVFALTCLRRGGLPRRLADAMLLPPGFGGAPEERLQLCLPGSKQAVMTAVESLFAFGQQRGLAKPLLNRAALCIEEMAGNVAEHAARPGQQAQMELLVLDEPEQLVIRLRDGQPLFNPLAALRTGVPPHSQPGLRITAATADDIQYARAIGLNSLRMVLKKNKLKETT